MLKVRYKSYLILFIILISACDISQNSDSSESIREVIDGDTVVLDDQYESRLRYIGINAPENLNEESPGDPFSIESTLLNRKLLDGKKIRIEYDKEKYDPYGRLLGYVFADETLVNEELLRQGLATLFFVGPNRKYEERFRVAEQEAKKFKRGIWSDHRNFKVPKGNKDFLIKPVDAEKFIGNRVVVRGKINDFRENRKVVILNIEDNLDLVIFKDALENFTYFNINPKKYYLGKPVESIGRIKMYRGRPQITVSHPLSIRVLE